MTAGTATNNTMLHGLVIHPMCKPHLGTKKFYEVALYRPVGTDCIKLNHLQHCSIHQFKDNYTLKNSALQNTILQSLLKVNMLTPASRSMSKLSKKQQS
jgi:hypothetical protein